ncbi:Site-specific recombinase XerD [Pseudosulfitobacter pseudonitzschiae]|uniref:Integrase n=1 Tax=Pseudosulfitobacter pseudonitzschiae TaxID=1402135 RepID=A0A073J6R2_9RHOB|nr:site-specific integrase [Pseudosulfitobacter pseudonitzschiae]KEJ97401.1 integrase [Pseudosulfitobacter pseudonitzschiae]QKS08692.1 site-specific integrase [Pseudosulfitobacter pseudonitzschiae]SHE72205.1 Site-specific recombinase XerD [Pseudosulfitobacter pseudonitzschiae]
MPFRTKKTRIYQYDIVVGGHRLRGSCGTEDFEAAKAIEADIRANAKRNASRGNDYTLSEALGTYINDKIIGRPSESTTKSQARIILSYMDGSKRISRLTDADIVQYAAKHRATCANSTVNRHLQMLGRAIRYMGKIYKCDIPPLDFKAAETKEPRERVRELTADEQTRLFATLPQEFHPMVAFALMTGARISTITGLLWRDVDMNHREITFRLKGDELMFFPINAELAALLSAIPKSNVMESRRYVFTRVDGHSAERIQIVASGGVFGTVWRKALLDAGIDNFRFHDLRHTFATRMLRKTQNISLVSKLLGHTNIETTSRYAHVMTSDLRDAMDGFSVMPTDSSVISRDTMLGRRSL